MTRTNQPLEEVENKFAKEIKARIAEKVREDSEKLARLTGIESIRTLAPDLEQAEFVAKLAEMVKDDRYKDIKVKLASATTGEVYLCSKSYITGKEADKLLWAEDIQARIAARIREDSEKLAKLTEVDSLRTVIPSLEPGKVKANLAEMVKDDRYKDIKLVAAATGPVYRCSERYITKSDADKLLRVEEIQASIAARIREGSKNLAKKLVAAFLAHEPKSAWEKTTEPLTKADTFSTSVFDDQRADKVDVDLTEMVKDHRFKDIKLVAAAAGGVYLYSEKYLTKNYAEILLGAEANDASDTIAKMVREASRVYRRPTNTELFKEPVFNIDPDELETHIAHMLEQPEFEDIKLIHASAGVRYLYSNLQMDEARAIKLVEWVEVKPA